MGVYNRGLPRIGHSLRQFVERGSALWEDNPNNPEPFVKFALTGEFLLDDVPHQAFVDAIQNVVSPHHELSISRDYDSVLGIARTILVEDNISIFTVPHPTFALKSAVHVTQPVYHNEIERDVDLHRIPNFEWGRFGPRHHLHVFFPGLWTPERSKSRGSYQTNERERAIWYDNGLRPAILELLGENLAHEWPASYETEEIRARRNRGGYSWSTKIIPEDIVSDLCETIRSNIDGAEGLSAADREWASNFFVLHTIRGAKSMTWHQPNSRSARDALERFLYRSHLSPDIRSIGEWYIDIAIEISSDEGACLQWVTPTHNLVVQQALLIDDANAARITDLGSSKYSRDYVSHLTAISGFRIVPGPSAQGPYAVKYLQAYTTDKAIVFNHDDGHHAKFLTSREAMSTIQPTTTISGLHTIYEKAAQYNGSNARLELRVPMESATLALLHLNSATLKRCMCIFTRKEWWAFRTLRLQAASSIISWQASGEPQLRVNEHALTLTAACVWLINGLHARPEDGPAARRLMDAALPVEEADEVAADNVAYRRSLPQNKVVARDDREQGDEDEEEVSDDDEEGTVTHRSGTVAHNADGCVFFRRIKFVDAPRFRVGGPTMPEAAFRFWFGASLQVIEARYLRVGILDKEVVSRIRSTMNKRRLPRIMNWNDEPLPDLFAIGTTGQTLLTPAHDSGSDVDDADTPPPERTLNAFVSEIFRTFVANVKIKSPNPRGNTNASYLKIDNVERFSSDESIFKDLTLSNTFRHVAYKYASKDEWKRAFNWLFPKRGYVTSSAIQNYPDCTYFREWLKFINQSENTDEAINEARSAIWNRLRTWCWIPDARQDKMWPTTVVRGFDRMPRLTKPDGNLLAAPRILIRGNIDITFVEEDQ
ncbi:hypothetical protein C0993_012195 [Termitomyces sp. T159_Od127]|nr:hypothetical protein C0993_012195 [Termitomyces sp. T159_Od127]